MNILQKSFIHGINDMKNKYWFTSPQCTRYSLQVYAIFSLQIYWHNIWKNRCTPKTRVTSNVLFERRVLFLV